MPHLVTTLIYLSQNYSYHIRGDRSPLNTRDVKIPLSLGGYGELCTSGTVAEVFQTWSQHWKKLLNYLINWAYPSKHNKLTQCWINFHTIEVVGRCSDTQLQVGENLNEISWRFKGSINQSIKLL